MSMMQVETLTKMNYGVYIVSAGGGAANHPINGCAATAVFQVTAEPIQVALSLNKSNYTHEYIEKAKAFSVSILSQETSFAFIGRFGFKSGRDLNKFENTQHVMIENIPVVTQHAVGYLLCQGVHQVDVGTHTLFIARVTGSELLADKPPMTYDYYHKVVKGKTPPSAATYIKGS